MSTPATTDDKPKPKNATNEDVEFARQDLARRLNDMLPKMSTPAADIVAILNATKGCSKVSITPVMASNGSYSSDGKGWAVTVEYAS